MGHPALELSDHRVELGLSVEMQSLGELSLVNIIWGWEVSGGLMPWTQLSHLRGSGLTPGWSTRTLPGALHRRKGRKKRKNELTEPKTKAKVRQNHTKKHTSIHSKNGKKKKGTTKAINKPTNENKH